MTASFNPDGLTPTRIRGAAPNNITRPQLCEGYVKWCLSDVNIDDKKGQMVHCLSLYHD